MHVLSPLVSSQPLPPSPASRPRTPVTMRSVAMLCLIAGASSLQLFGMRAAAPSLLASPRTTRCSLHRMSEWDSHSSPNRNPKGINYVLVEQLNAKSKRTRKSVIEVFEAIVAKAGEDFKAGLSIIGLEAARIIGSYIGLAMVSSAALLSPSLSNELRWTLGLASAVIWQIRRALPAR